MLRLGGSPIKYNFLEWRWCQCVVFVCKQACNKRPMLRPSIAEFIPKKWNIREWFFILYAPKNLHNKKHWKQSQQRAIRSNENKTKSKIYKYTWIITIFGSLENFGNIPLKKPVCAGLRRIVPKVCYGMQMQVNCMHCMQTIIHHWHCKPNL